MRNPNNGEPDDDKLTNPLGPASPKAVPKTEEWNPVPGNPRVLVNKQGKFKTVDMSTDLGKLSK